MADIELVIKISEKAYNALIHTEFDANLVVDEMRKSIAHGTPLPKGHGRLEEKRMITIDMEMPRCCIGCPILRDSYGQETYYPFVCEENNINIKQRTDRPSDCPLKEGD